MTMNDQTGDGWVMIEIVDGVGSSVTSGQYRCRLDGEDFIYQQMRTDRPGWFALSMIGLKPWLRTIYEERQAARTHLESALSEVCYLIAESYGLWARFTGTPELLDFNQTRDALSAICGEVLAMDATPPAAPDSERVAGLQSLVEIIQKWKERYEIARDACDGMRAAQLLECRKFIAELEAALAACVTGVR